MKQVQDVLHSDNYTYPQLSNNSQHCYTQLLLDSKVLTQDPDVISAMEAIARQMIYKFHRRRTMAAGGGSRYTWAWVKGKQLNRIG